MFLSVVKQVTGEHGAERTSKDQKSQVRSRKALVAILDRQAETSKVAFQAGFCSDQYTKSGDAERKF